MSFFYGCEMWSLSPRVGHTEVESALEQSAEKKIGHTEVELNG